ncbi:uncharacterized protein LOC144431339 [Styela clava]
MAKGFGGYIQSGKPKRKIVLSPHSDDDVTVARKVRKILLDESSKNIEVEDAAPVHRTCIICGLREARASFVCCFPMPVLCLECEMDIEYCPNCRLNFTHQHRR